MALPGDTPKLHSYVLSSYIFSGGSPGQKANSVVGPGGGIVKRAGFISRGIQTGTNTFTLQVNGVDTNHTLAIVGTTAVGDYNLLILDDADGVVEVEAGDLISWETDGAGAGGGWYYVDTLIEGRGDASVVATFSVMNAIETADERANFPCPFDGELVAIGYASVDTASDVAAVCTIERYRGTTTANRFEDGGGVTVTVPITAINAGGLLTLDTPLDVRAGDGLSLVTDNAPTAGGEFNFMAYFKVLEPAGLCLGAYIGGFGVTTSDGLTGAIQRGVVRRMAYALESDHTGGDFLLTMEEAIVPVVPARTASSAIGDIAKGTGDVMWHGEQQFAEGAAFGYASDGNGAGGVAYLAVILEK
jgi:hypothetical protein